MWDGRGGGRGVCLSCLYTYKGPKSFRVAIMFFIRCFRHAFRLGKQWSNSRLMFLCHPCSIFRVFSSDRKRVETALENCNLPSGRVRRPKHSAFLPSLFVLISPPPSWFSRVRQCRRLSHPRLSWHKRTRGSRTDATALFLPSSRVTSPP